jgi:hypothetical protein
MPEVPTQRTDFGGPKGFATAVHAALMRRGLSDVSARILTAHSVLSTNWGKAVHNFNLAGMKASSSWRATRPYVVTRGCECRPGLPDVGDPACICKPGEGQFYKQAIYWRAYGSLDEGAQAFVDAVRQPRYAVAYARLLAGDPEYFAAIGRAGWYTADPDQVKTLAIRRLETVNEFLGEPEGIGIGPLVAVVALVWYALA